MGELILDGFVWLISELWVSRSRLWRVVAALLFLAVVGLLIFAIFG